MWDEICFLLSERDGQNLPERDFENQVVRSLEVMGWNEYRREIRRQQSIQIGRGSNIRPDLTIYGPDNDPVVVIEVKRPSEDIGRDSAIGQLRSYMRQMKCEFGILFGSEIRLFYDSASNRQPDPLLIAKLPLERDLPEGERFARLFGREGFLRGDHLPYVEEKLSGLSKRKQVDELLEIILSSETHQAVMNYLRNEFMDYGDEVLSEVLQCVEVKINRIGSNVPSPGQERPRRRRDSSREGDAGLGGSEMSRFGRIEFESGSYVKLLHIYAVLYYMGKGKDFSEAVHCTLRDFPNVKDYQTISDKCARGFADSVDNFKEWYRRGTILEQLRNKLRLSANDYATFRDLLTP